MKPIAQVGIVGLFVLAIYCQQTCVWSALIENNDSSAAERAGDDTIATEDFKSIFLGRCNEYQNIRHKEFIYNKKNCVKLWETFSEIIRPQPDCDKKTRDYTKFIAMASHYRPKDHTIFWSRLKDLVRDMTNGGRQYVSMEETLIGYILDETSWCAGGGKTCPGSCPTGVKGIQIQFWMQASTQYAQTAEGIVTVVLNGSSYPAFRSDSIFATYELPNLQRRRVSAIHVQVAYNLEEYDAKNKVDTCTSGSVLELEKRVKKGGFPYKCDDRPKEIMLLQCALRMHPSKKVCENLVKV